jgi:glyoxylase-like metal-dependent hydrolase (beta-lactamase superfamily II)
MQESGSTCENVELVPAMRAGGIEIHLLQQGDIRTGVPDESGHGAQRVLVMNGWMTAPAACPFGSVAVRIGDIPSEDFESHDILLIMRIIVVDCKYVESEFAAAYLLIDGGRGFFIECNTNHAIPLLVEAVHAAGLSPEQIEGLLITHVHLDHAGGAGLFLETFPNALLYAHPRAARHAIDPSRLVQSATRVYGEEFMQRLYGTILPCPAGRVRELEDRSTIPFGPAGLEIRHVRGHANHHVVAREPVTGTVFTGDAFGVAYPASSRDRVIVIPSTSPTDFDGVEALQAVDLIESLDPERVALTHFGFIERDLIPEAADRLRIGIRISMEIVDEIRSGRIQPDQVESELMLRLSPILPVDLRAIFHVDLRVNAQGLIHAGTKA